VADFRRRDTALRRKKTGSRLGGILKALRSFYGRPEPPAVTEPFAQILFENVAYLASDARRTEAFRLLRKLTSLKPDRILLAPRAALHEIGGKGIMPGSTVEKLREIAAIALDEFGGDLSGVLRRPPGEAIRALKKFPSIGDPGAEKILLFSGAYPVLALDSNGLRVLRRLGFGKEYKNYTKSYRSAQEAAAGQIPQDCAVLIEAHQLLRRHGHELCKAKHPHCEACPVRAECVYFKTVSRKHETEPGPET
jgi:endonuclease-3